MHKIKRSIKMIGIYIIGIIGLLIIAITAFLNLSPQFGGKITTEQKAEFIKSDNYIDGKFINMGSVEMNMGMKEVYKSLKGYFKPLPNTIPSSSIKTNSLDSLEIANYKGETRMMWFGHSTFLMQINGKTILIDPMLSEVPAPHPWLGTKRFSDTLPILIEQLPSIDIVLISHDHYDHLDYESIKKLKDKVEMFYVPLGVGTHLRAWDVEDPNIVELDWWEEKEYEGITLRCTPAQHFSGRGLNDRGDTLWGSWVITTNEENIFFSGDSGYGAHFKEIGEEFGPFDFAMIECGQYNELWKEIHMFPEETVQAAIDVRAKKMMPIHWGAFKLAMHSWTEPVEKVTKIATEKQMPIVVPEIGNPMYLSDNNNVVNHWWRKN